MCLAKTPRGDISGWGKNDGWDGSEMEVTEKRMLELGQSMFTSQLALIELGNHRPVHDLPDPPFLYL